MPHTRSAKKNVRKSEKRRRHNRAVKKGVKDQLKEFAAAVEEGSPDQLKAQYNLSAKKLDKAAAKRVIHPNTAARKKSQLAKQLRAKLAGPAPTAG
jgi:small subunit ribosomal protein S20